jgi:hypothetical protein
MLFKLLRQTASILQGRYLVRVSWFNFF